MSAAFPCPCCGHLVLESPPGSDDICLICFWEDDATQLRFPSLADVTNTVSLREAQSNYAQFGAIEERFAGDVRKPTPEDALDPEFRPITESDSFETEVTEDGGPSDPTALYYWRPTFWRRS
jgi:Cysteine-rich CPCC